MPVYINGMGNISPQKTWDESAVLETPLIDKSEKLVCQEPDYTNYIDPRQLRRMSRIIKMGVAAGTIALRNAHIEVPDGIITGTAYGCLEDTGIFLNKMIENKEHALNPTPFIQSTHNTIGSQIALLLQCQGYNQTYTQGAFSFENALLDCILQVQEDPRQTLLAGGIDEITETSHNIQRRFGLFSPNSCVDSLSHEVTRPRNGEGAAFFVLSGKKIGENDVCIEGLRTFYKPSPVELEKGLIAFLQDHGVTPHDVSLVLSGRSGHPRFDSKLDEIQQKHFKQDQVGAFKHLCGEYPTASSFALWLAAKVLQENFIPSTVVSKGIEPSLNDVLIFNSYFGTHYSLILLRKC